MKLIGIICCNFSGDYTFQQFICHYSSVVCLSKLNLVYNGVIGYENFNLKLRPLKCIKIYISSAKSSCVFEKSNICLSLSKPSTTQVLAFCNVS